MDEVAGEKLAYIIIIMNQCRWVTGEKVKHLEL
jgi:hypothetical protein